jgi:diphthine synthase
MLSLIGLGLNDEKDLTLRGIEEAKSADKVYLDLYTGIWNGNLKKLEKIIGKKIERVNRAELEDNSKKIIDEAKNKKVAILVQGDPLVATTHTSLILEARKNKIKTKIIHNASIVSAIAETGLHIYKFGPTVTIPFPEKTKGQMPESIYETIKANKERGLHTLCLLDIVVEKEKNARCMTPDEAMKILLELEGKKREKVFTEETEIVVFEKIGSGSSPKYDKANDLMKKKFDVPAVLIIPGKMHFTEKEFLEKLV